MSSACLQHMFENPLPAENPTLLESLSWNQIKPVKSIDHSSSFTEIFGELHFKETPQSPSPPPPPSSSSSFSEINHAKLVQNEIPEGSLLSDINQTPSSPLYVSTTPTTSHACSDKGRSLSSESLHLCTEGLGFESSSDDVEELKINGVNECWETDIQQGEERHSVSGDCDGEWKRRCRSRVNWVEYPPPISCIGRSGKPWVSFRSYRNNGRFVLKEIRIPTRDFLHAHREDGRLMLHFVQPDEEFLGGEEEEEEEEDFDGVESTDEEEENIGKENQGSVTDQLKEKRD